MKLKFPALKILDIYIIKKFLGTYLFAISLFIIVIIVFDAVEKTDNFIKYKPSFSAIVSEYFMNFVPYLINQFSGLFTFISVIFFTSKMAYKTEIVAILSSGISFRRLLWPYFISALIITMGSLALNLAFIPKANKKRIAFENVYVSPVNNNLSIPHTYIQSQPGVFVYIRNYMKSDDKASYIVIEKHEGNRIVTSVEASNVSFDAATLRWKAPKYLERTYTDDGEIFEIHENFDTMINITEDEFGRVDQLIETMAIDELNVFIEQQRAKGSNMVQVFEVEKHRRFSYPISTFILTLIGLSLSSRKVRGGTGLHIGIGIGLCFSYILFARFAEEFAKSGVLPAAISVWIPNMLYSLVAVYLYIKAPK